MRKKYYFIILIPIVFFIAIAILVSFGLSINIESYIYNKSILGMSPFLTEVLKIITTIGNPSIVVLICLVLLLLKPTRLKFGIPVSITVVVSSILNTLLKILFTRPRPDILRLIPISDYSFPSGHAMINASLYTMIIILIFRYVDNKYLKIILSTVSLLLVIFIGYSRVYLGVHYAGDILGGWLLGFTVAISTYLIYKKFILKENII